MSNNLETLNSFVQELEVKMGQSGQTAVLLEGILQHWGNGRLFCILLVSA